MLNAVQQTHLNVCVKLALKEILYKDVLAQMSVTMHLALMELNVSVRKEDTNAFARREWLEILTKHNAFMKIPLEKILPAKVTRIALQTCTAKIAIALVRAQTSLVGQMLIVTLRITLDGVVAVLDLLKARMVAFQSAKDIFADKVLCVSSPQKDQHANAPLDRLEILSLVALA